MLRLYTRTFIRFCLSRILGTQFSILNSFQAGVVGFLFPIQKPIQEYQNIYIINNINIINIV